MEELDIIIEPELEFTLKKCGDIVPYGITPEERAKLAGIEENANNYTHPETHSSSILDVVDVVDGAANKFLNERGEMVAVKHESLTDKNSEAAVQHIDTTTTKPTLDEADMVAIKDSVTGKMVLTPKSNLGGDNLIAEYIHSGNTEIQPTALDLSTGIFTLVGHGITNSVNVLGVLNDFVNSATDGLKSIPFELVNNSNLYFIRVDNDRFYISLTLNGAAITYTNVANTAVNVANFHFEISSTQNFSFTALDLKDGIIRMFGKRGRYGASYVTVNGQYTRPIQPDGLNWQYLTKIIDFDFKNRIYYSNAIITYYQPNNYNSYGHNSVVSGDVLFLNSQSINRIGISFQFANGFTFQIYKK